MGCFSSENGCLILRAFFIGCVMEVIIGVIFIFVFCVIRCSLLMLVFIGICCINVNASDIRVSITLAFLYRSNYYSLVQILLVLLQICIRRIPFYFVIITALLLCFQCMEPILELILTVEWNNSRFLAILVLLRSSLYPLPKWTCLCLRLARYLWKIILRFGRFLSASYLRSILIYDYLQ